MYMVISTWTTQGIIETETSVYFVDTFSEAKEKLKDIVEEYVSVLNGGEFSEEYLERIKRTYTDTNVSLCDQDKDEGLIVSIADVCKQKIEGSFYMTF